MKFVGRLAAVLAVVLMMPGSAAAYGKNDTQARYAQSFSKRINSDWSVYLYQEFNWGDDASNFYCNVHEPGVVYSGLAKWLDLSLAYVKVYSQTNGDWVDENVYYIAGTWKGGLKGWSVSVKNRVEYDQKEGAQDNWAYRPFITITSPFKFTRFEIQPFVADELFYSFDEEYLTGNEFRAGVNFKITERVGGGLYYLVKHSHSHSSAEDFWSTPAHVIATSLSFNF